MGQGILTGQAAPPAQPYSLRADLRAWRDAWRGLGENPLLTHLRLAERRRLKRVPRWRRNLPLMLSAGASWLIVNLLSYFFTYSVYNVYQFWSDATLYAVILVYVLWLMQGVFQAVLGALGVLGRWARRPNHLVLDDFAALTNLNDHEIAAGAAASLMPPLAWRLLAGGLLLAALPVWQLVRARLTPAWAPIAFSSRIAQYGANLADFVLAHTLQVLLLGSTAIMLSALAALALVLWFLCLGRSLNVEKIGILAAGAVALSQIAYPAIYLCIVLYGDWGPLLDVFGSFASVALIATMLWLLAPGVVALLLGLARRLPWLRVALTVASPLVFGALLLLLLFILFYPIDTVTKGAAFISCSYAYAIQSIVALATGALAILAPQTIITVGWADPTKTASYVPTAVLLLVPMQLCMLFIISRFAVEAVGARRRRGE